MWLFMAVVVASAATVPTPYQLLGVNDSYAVCNDGSPYKFYLQPGDASTWLFYYQGGAWCFDRYSCDERWAQQPGLMTSKLLAATATFGSGILTDKVSQNPIFASYTKVLLPYCTSDDFSGNAGAYPGMPWSFMGSHVTPAVIRTLLQYHGLNQATDVVVSGGSAGGEAIYPNVDNIKNNLLPNVNVWAINDSGWFLASDPYYAHTCKDAGSCTEQAGIQKGAVTWNPVVDADCAAGESQKWRCLMGPFVGRYIQTPMFLFQFRFDLAQMGHDGIGNNPNASASEMQYAVQSAANLTSSMASEKYVFLPSCYHHTIITQAAWSKMSIQGTSLWDALRMFLKGQSVRLIDSCNTVGCNPTCPP